MLAWESEINRTSAGLPGSRLDKVVKYSTFCFLLRQKDPDVKLLVQSCLRLFNSQASLNECVSGTAEREARLWIRN
jgi:hypothetical protein